MTAIKLTLWGPPPSQTITYTLRIYSKFDSQNRLTDTPIYTQSGTLDQNQGWQTISLSQPLDLAIGDDFIVDIDTNFESITIDAVGKNSGRSYYKYPDQESYTALSYDIRMRAIMSIEHNTLASDATFSNGKLFIPRIVIPSAKEDYSAIEIVPEPDNQYQTWTVSSYTESNNARLGVQNTFDGITLFLPEVTVDLPGSETFKVYDATFTIKDNLNLILDSYR